MSHYCCKSCGQRYDNCTCVPDVPEKPWTIEDHKAMVKEYTESLRGVPPSKVQPTEEPTLDKVLSLKVLVLCSRIGRRAFYLKLQEQYEKEKE